VLIYDDDGFYLASVLAEWLRQRGREVILLTPEDVVAPWTVNNLEYRHIQKRLRQRDVRIVAAHQLLEFAGDHARIAMRLDRPRAAHRVRQRGHGHRAPARGRAAPGTAGARVRVGRRTASPASMPSATRMRPV
jgi:hypothetical protein